MSYPRSVQGCGIPKETDGSYVVLFLRGDLEANQTKLTNYLGCDVRPAAITPESGLCAGFIGPVGLCGGMTVLYDTSLQARAISSAGKPAGIPQYGPAA